MEHLKGFKWDMLRFGTTYTVNTGFAPWSAQNSEKYVYAGSDWIELEPGGATVPYYVDAYYEAGTTAGAGTLYVLSGDVVNNNGVAQNLEVHVAESFSMDRTSQSSQAATCTPHDTASGTLAVGGAANTLTVAAGETVTLNKGIVTATTGNALVIAGGTVSTSADKTITLSTTTAKVGLKGALTNGKAVTLATTGNPVLTMTVTADTSGTNPTIKGDGTVTTATTTLQAGTAATMSIAANGTVGGTEGAADTSITVTNATGLVLTGASTSKKITYTNGTDTIEFAGANGETVTITQAVGKSPVIANISAQTVPVSVTAGTVYVDSTKSVNAVTVSSGATLATTLIANVEDPTALNAVTVGGTGTETIKDAAGVLSLEDSDGATITGVTGALTIKETGAGKAVTYTDKFALTSGATDGTVDAVYTATGNTLAVQATTKAATVESQTASLVVSGDTDLSAAGVVETVTMTESGSKLEVGTDGGLTLTQGKFTNADNAEIAVNVTAGQTVEIDDFTFSAGTTGTYDKDGETGSVALASISNGATNQVSTEESGVAIQVGTTEYITGTAGATVAGTTADNVGKLMAGSVKLDADNKAIEVGSLGRVTAGTSNNIIVYSNGNITRIDENAEASFTTQDTSDGDATTYSYAADGKLTVISGGVTKVYEAGATVTMKTGETAFGEVTTTGLAATDIVAKDAITAGKTKYYNAKGAELPGATGSVVTVAYAQATTSVSITVESGTTPDSKIDLTGAKVTGVTLNSTTPTFFITTDEVNAEFQSDSSATFTVENNAVTGSITALTANGAYALGDAASQVTFAAGEGGVAPNGAVVTLASAAGTLTIVETTNTGAATVIKGNGAITGLDAGASVTSSGKVKATVKTVDAVATGVGLTMTGTAGVTAASGGTVELEATNDGATFTATTTGNTGAKATYDGTTLTLTEGTYTQAGSVSIEAAADVTIGDGTTKVVVASGTKATYNSNTLTISDTTGTVTSAGSGVTVDVTSTNGGTYSVNGVSFTTDAAVTLKGSAAETTVTVSNLTSGNTFTVNTAGANVTMGDSGTAWTAVGEGVVFTAAATLSATTAKLTSGQSATVATYTISDVTSSDGVTVSKDGEVSGLGAGESVKITNGSGDYKIFTAVSTNKVTVFDSTNGSTAIYGNANITDPNNDTFSYSTVATSWNSPPTATASGIVTSNISVTTNYSALGAPGATGDAIAATVTVNGETSKTVSIVKELSSVVVDISDDTATITVSDSTGNTSVKTLNGTISGKSFTAVKGGTSTVISNATDGIKALSGSVVAGSSFNVDASAAATAAADDTMVVSYVAGASLSEAKITVKNGNQITLTESSNTATTQIKADGSLVDVEGDATITGAVVGKTIKTTNSGATSINGTTWTVEGDDNGVVYTVADTKGKISNIEDLATGAKVSTTADVSGTTIGGITIDSAKSGLSFTQTASGQDIALATTGDSVTVGSVNYKVNASSDGIVVSTGGTITGLTDGEKVTVTNGTTETVYEVTGNTLVTAQTDNTDPSNPVTKTYTSVLADGETDGFTVVLDGKNATNAAKDADKTTATNGLTLGGTSVDTVTTGMMVDASGNATASSQKAVAEVTILNDGDEIKYTSKQDKKQTVAVAAGDAAANKEWDITTGGGSDAITFAGAKDATINAGNGNNEITLNNTGDVSVAAGSGNDTIDIQGTGDALVSVAGGRNVISHTGTGTASIAGGTGNDTISSANENDLIYGGAGDNTFKTTAGVTNKISDFTFGADKAALAGVTGALDASQVVVSTDGTIAYGDKATSGALDVSAEGFDGFYAVSIADQDGKHKLNVGWTGENGGMINASGLTEKALLIGNSEGRADTLMGGSSGDTLKAGTGDSSLWGGAGNDTLVSSTEASTSFFFLAGDGQDKVQGFKAYTEDTKDTADTLDFYGQGISSVMLTDSGIKVTKGTDSMTLVGSYDANTMIQWKSGDAKGIAKVGKNAETNSFTYDGAVTNYLGGTKTDTVTVSDDGMDVNIWLDGSQGVAYDSIEVLDASSVTGKATLAGGAGSNTITGGQGASSLWGGADGSNDVLNAGSGTNTFFYGLNEGNDVVNGTKEGDTVNLFNLNLSDITSAVIEDGKITVTQSNGQTLTVNGQANTFTLADGTTWRADHSSKTWSQAQ